jgi:hypothetical protein
MFWMTVYFVLAYGVVALLLLRLALRRRFVGRRVSSTETRGKRVTVALLLLLPLAPYAIVTIQTVVMLPWLQPALTKAMEEDYGKGVHPRIVRVLRVVPVSVVYAVLPCWETRRTVDKREVGALFTFQRSHGAWQWDGVPDCAWSECGSADGNTFPPYPEASEF